MILLILVTMAMTSCSTEPTRPDVIKEYTLNGDIFPMHVGDKWVYETEDNDVIIKITDQIQIAGNTYFVFEERIDNVPDYVYRMYYRPDQYDSNKIYTLIDGIDYLYLDFNRSNGEVCSSISSLEVQIMRKDFSYTVPAGIFNKCVELYFNNQNIVDEEHFNIYSPGIGMIELNGIWMTYRLKSAIVDGVHY